MPRESPVVNYLRRDAAPKNFAKNDYKLCSIGRAIKRGRGWGGRTSVLGCTSTGIYFYWAIVTDWWTSRRLFERGVSWCRSIMPDGRFVTRCGGLMNFVGL